MSTIVQPPAAGKRKPTSKSRKPRGPNYNQIHRHLLPVEIHPLPVLIPHNPLSLVAIALSYVVSLIAPPQRTKYSGYFSPTTSSVHVTDAHAIRALWEMGFFGRGSLSRSEPTWLETQKKKGATAEENTTQRRVERRLQKLERARQEQQEIANQLSKEQPKNKDSVDLSPFKLSIDPLKTNEDDLDHIDGVVSRPISVIDRTDPSQEIEEWKTSTEQNGLPTPPLTSTSSDGEAPEPHPIKKLQRQKTVRFSPTTEAREFDLSSPITVPIKKPGFSPCDEEKKTVEPEHTIEIEQQEHLNLSLEEAFFLAYGLGVLNVYCETTESLLSSPSLLSLFRRHSYFPCHSVSSPAEPDDPFMLSYVVYHHYRSLGWVVRSGVKFATDYLLYNRGPAFSHAEFAVIVLPSYSHRYWSENIQQRNHVAERTKKTWWWLHGVNRVQAQVHKHLILCYVDVPPPLSKAEHGQDVDIGGEIARYKIRDVGVRRWTPNRTRD